MSRRVTISIVVLCLLGGCGRRVVEGPPAIKYGQDECSLCGMILNEDRYAAALLIERNGARSYLLFDDLGDQFQFESRNHPVVISRFAHDFAGRQWIDAETAAFVQSESLHTPMGSGVVAFKNQSDATAKAAELGGHVNTFKELQAVPVAQSDAAPCCRGKDE